MGNKITIGKNNCSENKEGNRAPLHDLKLTKQERFLCIHLKLVI
jgi:hypothetical protein